MFKFKREMNGTYTIVAQGETFGEVVIVSYIKDGEQALNAVQALQATVKLVQPK